MNSTGSTTGTQKHHYESREKMNVFSLDPPLPPKFHNVDYVRTFSLSAPRTKVWEWLNTPETFTTQCPPYRVEFLSPDPTLPANFREGVYTAHHGPLLMAAGILTVMQPPEFRELKYCYGSYVISMRFARPTCLSFWLSDTPEGGTEVKLSLQAQVKSWFRPLWWIGMRGFWPLFVLEMKFRFRKPNA